MQQQITLRDLNVFGFRCIALRVNAAAQCPRSNGASRSLSLVKSRVVACMTAILNQMDDRHYDTYIETFAGTSDLVVSTHSCGGSIFTQVPY